MKPCQTRRRRSIAWLESRLRRIDRKLRILDQSTPPHMTVWSMDFKARLHTRRHELANQVQAAWAERDGYA